MNHIELSLPLKLSSTVTSRCLGMCEWLWVVLHISIMTGQIVCQSECQELIEISLPDFIVWFFPLV